MADCTMRPSQAEDRDVKCSVQSHRGMAQAREKNPQQSERTPVENVDHREKQKRGGERSRVHVLIDDEERGACNR